MQEIVNIRDTMKALEPEAIKKPFAEVLHEVQEYISSTYASVLKDNPLSTSTKKANPISTLPSSVTLCWRMLQ